MMEKRRKRNSSELAIIGLVLALVSNYVLVPVFADTGMGGDPGADAAYAFFLALILLLLLLKLGIGRDMFEQNPNIVSKVISGLDKSLQQTGGPPPSPPNTEKKMKPCSNCNSPPDKWGAGKVKCAACQGTGAAISAKDSHDYSCDPCKGTGGAPCPICAPFGGTGQVPAKP